MPEKLTVEELVKAVRCCGRPNGDACNNCPGDKYKSCTSVMAQAADALESLAAERDGYREQLAAALAENTRLAEKLAVKSEQLESLRTIFYEVTGSVPSKASQPVPLPEAGEKG